MTTQSVREESPVLSLTEARVRDLEPPPAGSGRRDVYRDSRTPGLILRVTETGVKSWLLYRRIGGRPRRVTIGRWPAVTVDGARSAVHEMLGEIVKGSNPADARHQVKNETTFGEVFTAYLEHAKGHKRTWQQDQEKYNRRLKPWANRPLSSITRADVAKLHAQVGGATGKADTSGRKRKGGNSKGGGHYAANRLLALLSTVYNFARDVLGYKGDNPARGVKRFREQSRDRFLRAGEIAAFWQALESAGEPWKDLFKLALLTGARKSNVQAMRWADLELDRGLWRIPGELSKNGDPLIVVLAPAAVEILRERWKCHEESEYVFPSWGKGGHVATTAKAWCEILQAARLADLRIHDLRRTLASWQAATGASLSIIGRTLGHRSIQATQVYARLDIEPVRESVETATAAIMQATRIKQLPLKKKLID